MLIKARSGGGGSCDDNGSDHGICSVSVSEVDPEAWW